MGHTIPSAIQPLEVITEPLPFQEPRGCLSYNGVRAPPNCGLHSHNATAEAPVPPPILTELCPEFIL